MHSGLEPHKRLTIPPNLFDPVNCLICVLRHAHPVRFGSVRLKALTSVSRPPLPPPSPLPLTTLTSHWPRKKTTTKNDAGV